MKHAACGAGHRLKTTDACIGFARLDLQTATGGVHNSEFADDLVRPVEDARKEDLC